MEKPCPPSPENFGLTNADVDSIPDIGNSNRVLGWTWLTLIGLFELKQAAAINTNDWAQHWLAYIIAGIFEIALLAFPAGIIALIARGTLDWASAYFSPAYGQVTKFRAAQRRYRAQLAEYDAWIRRQAENFWRSLDGVSFEHELAGLFQRVGFKVSRTPYTSDGGVDLILDKGGERIVVQCKAHASKVGIGTARELVASMIDFHAQKAILAVTSGVTKPVLEYVKGKNIQILDLAGILQLQRTH